MKRAGSLAEERVLWRAAAGCSGRAGKREGRAEVMNAERAIRIKAACLDFSRGLYPGEVGVEDVLETAAILYAWRIGALEISFEREGLATDEAGPEEEPTRGGEVEPFELADLRVLVRPVARESRVVAQAEEMERLEECLAESGWTVRQLKRQRRVFLFVSLWVFALLCLVRLYFGMDGVI